VDDTALMKLITELPGRSVPAHQACEPTDGAQRGRMTREPRIMLRLVGPIMGLILIVAPEVAAAQSMADLFGKVASIVVVVQAKGREASGIGSGVLISSDGKIMTAAHLVHGADEVAVRFLGGKTVGAHVVASELAADLSLIQLDQVPAGLRAARLANSDQVRVGDQVIVVGTPYGLSHSLSVGWISARWAPSTMYKAIPLAEFFQTDASINTGNSGGPMFSLAGEVIGIVSQPLQRAGGVRGSGSW
jgi:serine protease Do